jgi:sporulation protein YlmC with PRC-barrel domain
MMLFSQARGRPVITSSEAEALGTVDDLTIDPHTKSISSVRLAADSAHHGPIAWSAVNAFGPDAVIVHSRTAAEAGTVSVPEHYKALGSRVLTDLGNEHGTVEDIAFDPMTGKVETIYTSLGSVPGEHLMGLGSYALVVRAA